MCTYGGSINQSKASDHGGKEVGRVEHVSSGTARNRRAERGLLELTITVPFSLHSPPTFIPPMNIEQIRSSNEH
jgi:hypothetical protein